MLLELKVPLRGEGVDVELFTISSYGVQDADDVGTTCRLPHRRMSTVRSDTFTTTNEWSPCEALTTWPCNNRTCCHNSSFVMAMLAPDPR